MKVNECEKIDKPNKSIKIYSYILIDEVCMSVEVMGDIFLEAMKLDDAKKPEQESHGLVKKGKVVAVNESDIFLDLGSKSECVVPLSEFSQPPSYGETVNVVMKDMKDGVNIASKLEADKYLKMDEIKKAFENGLPINGIIEEAVYKDGQPKGFVVSLGFDIKAFLPLSQIDTKKEEKLENMKGISTDFAVIEYKRNNITISRREFLQKTIKKLYNNFFEKHNIGDIVQGIVERVEEDFIVLSVEGIRAFMHVSDFSWKFLSDMKKVVKIGDEMEVIIIKMERSKNSVKIGKKQLSPDPWTSIDSKYTIGAVIQGKVVNYRKDGAIVEVEDGIEAFLPVDEMSWTEKIRDPKKYLKPGSIVEVKIRNIEADRRRMDVSLRDIQDNPWDNADKNYSYGKKVEGVVTSIVDFGVFIKFEDKIEGLMRKEDVDWLDPKVDLKKKFKKGQAVQAMVLALDKEREKLRLGYKQLSDNPFKAFSMNYPAGSPISAVVKEILENGIIVSLENNLEGFIHISQISKEKVDKIDDVIKIGDEVKGLVKFVDQNKNKIEISIKDYLFNEEKFEVSKYMAGNKQDGNTVTIGSLLKDQLANINLESNNAAKSSKAK